MRRELGRLSVAEAPHYDLSVVGRLLQRLGLQVSDAEWLVLSDAVRQRLASDAIEASMPTRTTTTNTQPNKHTN